MPRVRPAKLPRYQPGPHRAAVGNDVAFLAAFGIPDNILQLASQLAASRGTSARQELFAFGFDRVGYWAMLARHIGLAFAPDLENAELVAPPGFVTIDAVRLARAARLRIGGRVFTVIAPDGRQAELLRGHLAASPQLRDHILIAAPETIRAFLVAHRDAAIIHYAVNRLALLQPQLSSRSRPGADRVRGPVTLLAAVLGAALAAPWTTLEALGLLSTLFFCNCGMWKLAAAFHRPRRSRPPALPSEELPHYTVLVPLYREAAVVADLVAHLAALDYPASKLQVIFVLETDDAASRAAVARYATPLMEVVVVPSAEPRTKPKALSYALPFARGEFVAVFDAEDRPEPDQLRKAAAVFKNRPELGCVQARLLPDNHGCFLSSMFTLEYAANFEVLLPALASWGMPLPLGGTSNHFPRRVLECVGGWDPFNVTEDADLGIRLARFGYRSATLMSHTFEEAPVTFRQWLPQRRRWIKGWMQTALVCLGTNIPRGLKLPVLQTLAVHGILSAGVLGLLLYPVSLVVVIAAIGAAVQGAWPGNPFLVFLLSVNAANLCAIVVAAAVSSWRGLRAARTLRLAWRIPLLPFYWALMSLAAWWALIQFFSRRSEWEKTTHGVARDRRPSSQRG